MKKTIGLLLITAACSCTKKPVVKCYTVINVKVVSYHPDRFEVTYARPKDTIVLYQNHMVIVGSNTCGGGAVIGINF